MQYDPIKRTLGNIFNKTPFLRKLFYRLLDLLLLRTWHIKNEVNKWSKDKHENLQILDAGSGFGQYVFFLSGKNRKWKIKGVDVKDEQIEDCNNFFLKINRQNVSFQVADLTKFTSQESFDMVLSVDVMEHILEDVLVFKNFYKAMKPGGMVLISTPSDQGGSDVHHHHHEHEKDSFIDEHVRDGYNIDEIQEKLKRAGFSKTEASYNYGTPGKISWKISMKYPILLLNFSKLFLFILPFYYLITFPFTLVLNYLDLQIKHKTGTGLIVKAWK